MRIIFWQNVPSPHQSAYIRAMARHPDLEIVLVTQEGLPQWRQKNGWSQPDFGLAEIYIQPNEDTVQALLAGMHADELHLFSGMRAYPLVWRAFRAAVQSGVRIGLISEPSDWRGINGAARLLRAKADKLRYAQRIDLILAIGHLAIRWFSLVGYPEAKLFPFIYTTETPLLGVDPVNGKGGSQLAAPVRLIFIGQCIHRKGIDLILEALSSLLSFDWTLDIIGDGEERPRLEEQCTHLSLNGRVRFRGSQANEEAMRQLETSDLLILPSRWDGWGAVINEALMRGVSVVCSDHCGAAELLRDPARGEIVRAGSVCSLRDALQRRIGEGKLRLETRKNTKDWSRCISGPSAAAYLLQVVRTWHGNQERPAAPWL